MSFTPPPWVVNYNRKVFILKDTWWLSHLDFGDLVIVKTIPTPLWLHDLKVKNCVLVGRGGGLVVSMLAFFFDDLNSNPAHVTPEPLTKKFRNFWSGF